LSILDNILEVLKNGGWHDLEEISKRTRLPRLQVDLLTNFLAEFNFIELDKSEQRTRLTPPLLSFIKKIQSIEEKEK